MKTKFAEDIFPRFKDHTILGIFTLNYKTGKCSMKTEEIYFKDLRSFDDLPEPCRSPEILEDYNNWVLTNKKVNVMNKFVLIGAAGFVSPRHMKAIKDVNGDLVAILDPSDSVGIIDSYFPNACYFSEFERFDRYCSKRGDIDYVSVASPNSYHFEQCIWAMDLGADVICEKPLCLYEEHINELLDTEAQTGKRIWNISQLRLGETVSDLKKMDFNNIEKINLYYTTPRGCWYNASWKGNVKVSGGLATAIGIHLFDILLYLFGTNYKIINWSNTPDFCSGNIEINDIPIHIELSIEFNKKAQRVLNIDGEEFELSKGFTDLHTLSYKNILEGKGIGIQDVAPAVILCEKLRKY